MNGFINVLKPPGMSSAAVVSFVKRMANEKHVGHAGTLDPEAAGVLPVMIGRATRLFDYLVDKEKSYVAECAFGASTDTQDAQGTVLETGDAYPTMDAVREACRKLTGRAGAKPWMFRSAPCILRKSGSWAKCRTTGCCCRWTAEGAPISARSVTISDA